MKKLIVFDWNGTLLADARASWLAGNTCLEYYGAQPISFLQYRQSFTFPILHFYKKNGLSVDHILEHKDGANKVFQAEYERLAKNARLRKGAREQLHWLQANGYDAIILSNHITEKIAEHVHRLKIGAYFKTISAHDCDGTTIMEHTTKSERLKTYMKAYGYTSEDTYIIGDSTEEPEIARLLGLTSIGITDGYITDSRLKKAEPDYIIHNLQALRDILRKTS